MGIVSWMVTPSKDLGLQNAILFGKKAFANIFKVRISKWDYFRLGWALNPIMSTSIKNRKSQEDRERQGKKATWRRKQRLEFVCKTEEDQNCQEQPEDGRGKKGFSSPRSFGDLLTP